jgi:hypothetical protein
MIRFTGSRFLEAILSVNKTKKYTLYRYDVVDWEAIVHKNVRSKDRADVGNVDAIEGGDTLFNLLQPRVSNETRQLDSFQQSL